MATFFTTGVPLTEEERQFKGVDYDYTKKLNPEQSMEAIKNNVITPVSNFLQTSGEKTQYNNVVTMSGVEAPSYDDIMNMSIEELSNAKNNIIQKKPNRRTWFKNRTLLCSLLLFQYGVGSFSN